MLSKTETEVMKAVYSICNGKQNCLVSPYDIINLLPVKFNCDVDALEKHLKALELDGYFELIDSDKKGEKMYVINLHPLGVAFKRTNAQLRRSVYFKLCLAVGGAVVSFIIGIILKQIFS